MCEICNCHINGLLGGSLLDEAVIQMLCVITTAYTMPAGVDAVMLVTSSP